jgi:rare lipoprotein A (peptidoglycan hydrolase)
MRSRLLTGALALAAPLAAAAHADAAVVKKKRLHVRVGRTVVVVGNGATTGVARLQLIRRGAWRTIDRDRMSAGGRYVLRDRMRRPLSARARVLVDGGALAIGRVDAYRQASASWYGPGLYGNRLGCGGTLTPRRLGVAHKSLPCGAKLTLRKGDRSVRVRVIDRGPYAGGREFDLTAATAGRLHFHGHGTILTTR